MALDIYSQRRAIWHWNTKRNVEAVADAIGKPASEVAAYLETLGVRGYPGRIRLHEHRERDINRIVPFAWTKRRDAYSVFDIKP